MVINPPARGRPPIANLVDLRVGALAVFLELGYVNVSMTTIAAELGVSVRTLHRYFPAKADIVWGGIEGSIDELRRCLAGVDQRLPLIPAVAAAMEAMFARGTDGMMLDRARVRLIATNPELQSTRPETYQQWREQTIIFVATRLGVSHDGVVARAVGAAIQSTIAEALAWWAVQSDDGSPVAAVVQALGGLEDALHFDPV